MERASTEWYRSTPPEGDTRQVAHRLSITAAGRDEALRGTDVKHTIYRRPRAPPVYTVGPSEDCLDFIPMVQSEPRPGFQDLWCQHKWCQHGCIAPIKHSYGGANLTHNLRR
eukprot:2432423-Pyramimonas_sp.AAC.1